MADDLPAPTPRGARSMQRIVRAAARLFGRAGFDGASMKAVARAAGVSKGLVHYHFRNKEHLLIEAQRATFRQIHARFDERFEQGERGARLAREAWDALWGSIRDMAEVAPFMVEVMSLSAHDAPLRAHVDDFNGEALSRLESALSRALRDELADISLPPARLARVLRATLYGLVVELAYARNPRDLAAVELAAADLADLLISTVHPDPTVQPHQESP